MSISDDIKKFYPDDWQEIREQVLERAATREKTVSGAPMPTWPGLYRLAEQCEWCGAPNGQCVWRGEHGLWSPNEFGPAFNSTGHDCGPGDNSTYDQMQSPVVLTIAHLDQDPRGDDPDRLRALCQRCHLQYDSRPEQKARRERIYAELRGQATLFGGAA